MDEQTRQKIEVLFKHGELGEARKLIMSALPHPEAEKLLVRLKTLEGQKEGGIGNYCLNLVAFTIVAVPLALVFWLVVAAGTRGGSGAGGVALGREEAVLQSWLKNEGFNQVTVTRSGAVLRLEVGGVVDTPEMATILGGTHAAYREAQNAPIYIDVQTDEYKVRVRMAKLREFVRGEISTDEFRNSWQFSTSNQGR
jgi:hypothetical protein